MDSCRTSRLCLTHWPISYAVTSLDIVFRDCQMLFCKIFIWEEMSSCCFSSVNLLNFLPKINRCWTIFETLAEIVRDCKERQLCMWDCSWTSHFVIENFLLRMKTVELGHNSYNFRIPLITKYTTKDKIR